MSSLVSTFKQEMHPSVRLALPVELWSKIFREATIVPTKNEFGTDPRPYNNMLCDSPVQSSQITLEELTVALKSRLNIVLVCKHWRDIGLPILYSHFRIPAKLSNTACQTTHQTLAGDDRLTNSVRRVTVVADGPFVKAADDAEAKKLLKMNRGVISILSLLPRLKIVVASPMLFWSMPLFARSNVAVANFTVREINQETRSFSPDGWDRLVHLTLEFSASRTFEYHEGTLPLSFPSLTSLHICTGVNTHNRLIKTISNKWQAPKLDTFWIYCFKWTPWLPFLAKHAPTLTILNIRRFPNDFTDQPPVHFPSLRQLFLEEGSTEYQPRTLVDAPHLERVVASQLRPPPSSFPNPWSSLIQIGFIKDLLQLWGTAEPIRAYCLLLEDHLFPALLSNRDLMKSVNTLRGRGSEVVFYLDKGGRQVLEPLNV